SVSAGGNQRGARVDPRQNPTCRHSRESGNPFLLGSKGSRWMTSSAVESPAFAGMTTCEEFLGPAIIEANRAEARKMSRRAEQHALLGHEPAACAGELERHRDQRHVRVDLHAEMQVRSGRIAGIAGQRE